jgi:hypothetical protein
MSWATCYNNGGSNPIHFDYPAIMMDGRNYTNWNQGAALNQRIKEQAGVTSNHAYREYLIKHGVEIMTSNKFESQNQCGNCNLNMSDSMQQNVPYVFPRMLDSSQPFGYETSDLKNYYLSRQDLQARMIAPLITQDELLLRGYPSAK